MTAIRYLDPQDVPAHFRRDYTGKRWAVTITETVTIPIDAGLWDGGTRDVFQGLDMVTGEARQMPGQDLFHEGRKAYAVTLPPGIAIMRRSYFQGKDTGIMIFVRLDDVAPMLPAAPTVSLSTEAHTVLALADGYKSSYRRDEAARKGIDARAYDTLRDTLAAQGLLKASGAITTAGKNALAALPRIL